MKNKKIIAMLSFVSTAFLAFSFAACDFGDLEGVNSSSLESNSTSWTSASVEESVSSISQSVSSYIQDTSIEEISSQVSAEESSSEENSSHVSVEESSSEESSPQVSAEESSSEESSPQVSAEESSSEESSSQVPVEESSSEESSSPSNKPISQTTWEQALSATAFCNVTITAQTDMEPAIYKLADTALFEQQGETAAYFEEINGDVYYYFDSNGSGNYTKMCMSGISPGLSLTDLTPVVEIITYADFYNTFSYQMDTNRYTADRIDFTENDYVTQVVLKFADDKLVYYSSILHTIDEETATPISYIMDMTLTDYGTTVVELPTINESTEDAVGDGVITENEWKAALSEDSFMNIQINQRITNESGSTNSMIYYNGSAVFKVESFFSGYDEENNHYSLYTTQFWTSVNVFVYLPEADAYAVVPITSDLATGYQSLYNTITGVSLFKDFYSFFTFNGYTATSLDGSITIIFNEQEKVSVYVDTENGTTITYLNYGNVEYTLPTNIYQPQN